MKRLRHILLIHAVILLTAELASGTIIVPSGFTSQSVIPPGTLNGITGLAFDSSGLLYINQREQLSTFDTVTSALTTVQTRASLNGAGTIIIGDGRPGFGTDAFFTDNNDPNDPDNTTQYGTVFQRDSTTGTITSLSTGAPGLNLGDPFGLAFGPGGGFGTDLYVMDFQGASPQTPLVFTVDSNGNTTPFATGWTTSETPAYLQFTQGNGFPDVLLASDFSSGAIWQITDTGVVTEFVNAGTFNSPTGMRFGPGGSWGTDLYVVDSGSIYTVDPSGQVTLFASGLPTQLLSNLNDDLTFANDGASLFVGAADELIQISLTAAVPEPSTYAMAILGMLGLVGYGWRRRRA